jgi:hypothetical protein
MQDFVPPLAVPLDSLAVPLDLSAEKKIRPARSRLLLGAQEPKELVKGT